MKPIEEKALNDHPKDLLLGYLEGELPERDRLMVNAHIAHCEECALELESLSRFVETLKTEKHVFCPEPWELYEFIEDGQDPEGKLAKHLEKCPTCSAEITEYKKSSCQTILPSTLKGILRCQFSTTSHSATTNRSRGFSWIFERVLSIFKVPVFAVGTAVVAVLLAIILYPHGSPESFIGLSDVNWIHEANIGTPKSLFSDIPKPKLAIVVIFKGFNKPLPQATIDSLYEALEPKSVVLDRFQLVPPVDLRECLEKMRILKDKPFQALDAFYKESSISFALVVSITANGEKFQAQSQVLDIRNGQSLAESVRSNLSTTELVSTLNNSLTLLNHVEIRNRTK
ncbi:MAG: zf-HC2 domain-containing protein [Desulfomonilaceae bacterium]